MGIADGIGSGGEGGGLWPATPDAPPFGVNPFGQGEFAGPPPEREQAENISLAGSDAAPSHAINPDETAEGVPEDWPVNLGYGD